MLPLCQRALGFGSRDKVAVEFKPCGVKADYAA